MGSDSPDEVVFTVAGSTATPVERISLEEAGLKEREHLQEWVLAHPEILGPDVMVVTFEFDHWSTSSGAPQKDRLDVLGFGTDGRIVLAELKRGKAPDTVDMQAIKYAAMASRFTADQLAERLSAFTRRPGEKELTETEALARLEAHSTVGLDPDQLVNPRIVLLAEDFPPSVTATAVWLNERGVTLTLMRYQAYRTGTGEIVLTVSQLYPVRDIAEFEVAPRKAAAAAVQSAAPTVPWSTGDLEQVATLGNQTLLALLDLCALTPENWVPAGSVYERARVSPRVGAGALGGFTQVLLHKLKRSNLPYERNWGLDGIQQAYYRMTPELAELWLAVRGDTVHGPIPADEDVDKFEPVNLD